MANLAREHRLRLLVDAAQTLGYLPLDVEALGIDLLAAPGHKGAAGPLGTGLLYAHPSVSEQLVNPWPGGTGTDSESLTGPFPWPQGFEAGNLNVPALAGWEAGLEWLLATPIDQRASSLSSLRSQLWEILQQAALAEVVGDDEPLQSAPVVSLITRGMPCSDAAALLDSSFQ
ncbi:MAG: aminotransferase class V-fold PLP-dependent enzyme, partial [Pirellulaceae bacterium]